MEPEPLAPQRLSFVTLGTRDMARARAFYGSWGWQEREGASDEFTQYEMGGVRLALYPLDLLGDEAAPGEPSPTAAWNGVTLAVNVASREAVDDVFRAVLEAGAEKVAQPVDREWGGRSGYVADPEGQRWEIAWLPGLEVGEQPNGYLQAVERTEDGLGERGTPWWQQTAEERRARWEKGVD